LGLKTLGIDQIEAALGVIRKLVLRRSILMNVSWLSDAHLSTWIVLTSGLSGLAKYLRAGLEYVIWLDK
jgi:hypothetical protein